MKNLIKSSVIFSLIFLLFNSCIVDKYDIYIKFPKGSLLTIESVKESESIFKTDLGFVLMYNLIEKGDDEYNPHLLFFDENNELLSACYFFSESIYSCEDNVITAYRNDHRSQRKSRFRNDIPSGINVKYLEYKSFIGGGGGITNNNLLDIKYNKVNNTVRFILNDIDVDNKQFRDIPLYKVKFDYNNEEIMINDIVGGREKKNVYFSISKEKLENLFVQIIDNQQ